MKLSRLVVPALLICLTLAAQEPTTNPPQTAPAAPAKRPNIPDKFTNLSVLPTTITKPELMGVMKQFSITMKVRCSYCHAVSDDLSEGSFASDEKSTKEDTRKLIRFLHQATLTSKS
jgi:hypothetical protein